MIDLTRENFYKAGKVCKPFGKNGEITVNFTFEPKIKIKKSDFIFLEIKNSLVPFFIEECLFKGENCTLKLETIDNTALAQKCNNLAVYLPAKSIKEKTKTQKSFIGFEVHDKNNGTLGTVNFINDSNHQVLAEILYNSKNISIPLIEELILSIDFSKKIIYMHLPDGILDL